MSVINRRTLMGAALTMGAALSSSVQAKPRIGQPAPKFSLTTFDQKTIRLTDLIGKVVVLNYWAVWCGPCKQELPEIDAYVRRHVGDDLKVFAVTIDDAVSNKDLKPLATTLSFPLARYINGRGYGPIDGAIPSNYVIDRSGVLRYARANAFNYGTFDQLITPLLAEKPVQTPPAV
ncbi:hypothetical protein AEAC466_00650 [Asticcacaulis sp. AC466]|uniref:TlpA family protein disulfide reductase n=1 Tax=Asticcacaulis sp. AC466 TaxID=1282362 RepID=UPI0003C3E320|nr:TlpA disulfide reductase family protein [Asticcacaulis sp. AC466]ESQ85713.1 hypothetical protein AEAC466_00650 [Asticcacaulis sp. AC466]